jgi:hypothetical protein
VKLFENYYRAPCMDALSKFSKRYWRCNFQYKNERCTLVMEGHGFKGHQKSDGKIFASGNYMADFDMAKTSRNWNDNLIQVIGDIQENSNRIGSRDPKTTVLMMTMTSKLLSLSCMVCGRKHSSTTSATLTTSSAI